MIHIHDVSDDLDVLEEEEDGAAAGVVEVMGKCVKIPFTGRSSELSFIELG